MRISRIPTESGKALEPRNDGKTLIIRRKPHCLSIISRHPASLDEKWGKSSKTPAADAQLALHTYFSRSPCANRNCSDRPLRKIVWNWRSNNQGSYGIFSIWVAPQPLSLLPHTRTGSRTAREECAQKQV